MQKLLCLIFMCMSTSFCFAETENLIKTTHKAHPLLVKRIYSWIGKIENQDSSSYRYLQKLGYVSLPYLYEGINKNYSVNIKKNIIKLIEELKPQSGCAILVKCVEDEDVPIRVREQAIVSIGNIGYIKALTNLQKYAFVKDARIYRASVNSICKMKYSKSIPTLLELLRHWDDEVIQKAQQALVTITNRSFSPSYKLWNEWWEENRYEWEK